MPITFASIYQRCQRFEPERDICEPMEMLQSVQVDFEGRPVSTSKYVIDDPRTRNSGLKPSDFALENQLIEGVEQRNAFCSHQIGYVTAEIERANKIVLPNLQNFEK